MENQYENDGIDFENYCETARKLAQYMGSLMGESFESEKLPERERAGRISHDIKVVSTEIEALDRLDYFLYRHSNARLFELFKNSGNLTNTEEMNKLQQAMILGERFILLQTMALNSSLTDHSANRKKNHPLGDSEQEALTLHLVMVKLQDNFHLVMPPSDIHDFKKIVTCHDWSTIRFKMFFGCQTNEVKCVIDCFKSSNPDLTYANIGRCCLFTSKAGKIITAHNLTTSSYKKLKSRLAIEKIIAAYKKKH